MPGLSFNSSPLGFQSLSHYTVIACFLSVTSSDLESNGPSLHPSCLHLRGGMEPGRVDMHTCLLTGSHWWNLRCCFHKVSPHPLTRHNLALLWTTQGIFCLLLLWDCSRSLHPLSLMKATILTLMPQEQRAGKVLWRDWRRGATGGKAWILFLKYFTLLKYSGFTMLC